MAVVISSGLLLTESPTTPLNHPRIGYHDYYRTGTVTASTEDGTDVAANVTDGLTWDWWRPTALPAWIQVDAGVAVTADYCAIAEHELGTKQVSVKLQYSFDGSSWSDATDEYLPADDKPLMFLFEPISARYWRLYLQGTTNYPAIAVLFVGQILKLQRGVYVGHTPMNLSSNDEFLPNRSEGGHWLGRTLIRQGNSTSVSVDNLKAAWVRNYFDDFRIHAKTLPFFFAWHSRDFPKEIAFGWSNKNIKPTNSGPKDFMSVSFDIEGVA